MSRTHNEVLRRAHACGHFLGSLSSLRHPTGQDVGHASGRNRKWWQLAWQHVALGTISSVGRARTTRQ
eukprot:13904641-Alexandrium_andersonii.AAC.1